MKFSIASLTIFSASLKLPSLIIILETKGPVVHWSKRIGKDEKIFFMPKFRSMIVNTPDLPTHKMVDPLKYVTKTGHYIRKLSIDELKTFKKFNREYLPKIKKLDFNFADMKKGELMLISTPKDIIKFIKKTPSTKKYNFKDIRLKLAKKSKTK